MKRSEKFALCRFLARINFFDDTGELLDPYSDMLLLFSRELIKELHLDFYELKKFYYDCCGGSKNVRK